MHPHKHPTHSHSRALQSNLNDLLLPCFIICNYALKRIFLTVSQAVYVCVRARSVAPLLIASLNICLLPLPRQNTSSSLKDTPHSLCTMKIRFSCCSFKLLYGMRFDVYEILSFFSSVLSFFQNTKKKSFPSLKKLA